MPRGAGRASQLRDWAGDSVVAGINDPGYNGGSRGALRQRGGTSRRRGAVANTRDACANRNGAAASLEACATLAEATARFPPGREELATRRLKGWVVIFMRRRKIRGCSAVRVLP